MSFVSKICVHAISPKNVLLVSENQRCLNKVTMAFDVLQSSFRPFHTHCKILHYRLCLAASREAANANVKTFGFEPTRITPGLFLFRGKYSIYWAISDVLAGPQEVSAVYPAYMRTELGVFLKF